MKKKTSELVEGDVILFADQRSTVISVTLPTEGVVATVIAKERWFHAGVDALHEIED